MAAKLHAAVVAEDATRIVLSKAAVTHNVAASGPSRMIDAWIARASVKVVTSPENECLSAANDLCVPAASASHLSASEQRVRGLASKTSLCPLEMLDRDAGTVVARKVLRCALCALSAVGFPAVGVPAVGVPALRIPTVGSRW
jgi:hypothetical protein